jgi:hypothetical protein
MQPNQCDKVQKAMSKSTRLDDMERLREATIRTSLVTRSSRSNLRSCSALSWNW